MADIFLYVFGGHTLWRTHLCAFLADIYCGGHFFLYFWRTILWWASVFADISCGGHLFFRFFADISCGGHLFLRFFATYLVADISFYVFLRPKIIFWRWFRFAFFADISCGVQFCTWRTQLALAYVSCLLWSTSFTGHALPIRHVRQTVCERFRSERNIYQRLPLAHRGGGAIIQRASFGEVTIHVSHLSKKYARAVKSTIIYWLSCRKILKNVDI